MLPAPESLSDADLESSITTLAAYIHAATYRLLMLLAEFDRRRTWAEPGMNTCAHWMSWKCGIALGAAREKLRVAHALEALPETRKTFERGELSYSKARALTRVATPENESRLLNVARQGTAAHLERLVRGYRRVLAHPDPTVPREPAGNARRGRYLRWRWDDDGALIVEAHLDPEAGARLIAAIESAVNEDERELEGFDSDDSAPGVSAETRPEQEPDETTDPGTDSRDVSAETRLEIWRLRNALRPARRADALLALVERGARAADDPEIRANPAEIVVHIDAETLAAIKERAPTSRSHLEHGPHLAPETARRLACDAAIVALVERSTGEPLSIGRRSRAVPAPMRRALHARDGGCRFPGCTATHRLEAHHIHHWSTGGRTEIGNLTELCARHHTLVHEGGYRLERLTDGRLQFSRPDGHTIPACPRRAAATPEESMQKLQDEARSSGVDIDHRTCVAHWDGGSMDYAMAVDGLLWADGRMVI